VEEAITRVLPDEYIPVVLLAELNAAVHGARGGGEASDKCGETA
jgi:hypothetical protein